MDEVPRGNACGCVCIFCDVPMQARKGGINREHFSHQPRLVDDEHYCPASFQRSIFWMARRILSESREISLPSYDLTFDEPHYGLRQSSTLVDEQRLKYDSIIFPYFLSNLAYDVALLNVGEYTLAVTLVFGGIDTPGAFVYQEQALAHVVIEMRPIELLFDNHKTGFRLLMESLLLSSLEGKRWTYYPTQEALAESFKAKFEAAVQAFAKQENERTRRLNSGTLRQSSSEVRSVNQQPLAAGNVSIGRDRLMQRVSELVHIVQKLNAQNVTSGYLCEACKIMRKPHSDICSYCGHKAYTVVPITSAYLSSLEKKYWCWNYAEKSLAVVPKIGSTTKANEDRGIS
ncbi:MAG: hypothetical protein FHK82_12110 [Sedimenticola thiotaurini]|uniref:Uncharacterized protein n=1 Tax=Sedimenticola thiotaurini TaxID=1543721 RepID=A0A558CX98_9GAMM|nr:MAG: hypothetical protein FHK82_12110 [Sedimenticola thiotaurini]